MALWRVWVVMCTLVSEPMCVAMVDAVVLVFRCGRLGQDAAAVEIQQLKDQVDALRSLEDTANEAERAAAVTSQKNALMASHISRLEEQGRTERQLLKSQVRHLTSEVARLQVRGFVERDRKRQRERGPRGGGGGHT